MKRRKLKADPYGTDEQFGRYVRSTQRKAVGVIIVALALLAILCVTM